MKKERMEFVYQYLWRYGLFGRRLPLSGGGTVDVLRPGVLNRDSGPDFFNALLEMDSERWAGNVEIHVKASDWYRHGHDRDLAYDSVVLHVVGIPDAEVTTTGGRPIPMAQVDVPERFFITYGALMADRRGVRCQPGLKGLTALELTDWIETLSVERLHQKAARINSYVSEFGGDWERAFFVALARAFGFGLNSVPFELLAKSVELKFIRRHSDNLMQIEALLFGQAGMLDPSVYLSDSYYQTLCREYRFLAVKYGLQPIGRQLWKYSRTRPDNFPHRRIAFLARMLYESFALFDTVLDHHDRPELLCEMFSWELKGYWSLHSDFGTPERSGLSTTLGRQSVCLLVINAVVPVMYAYGVTHGDDRLTDSAVDLLEYLPAERNSILTQWGECGLKASDAMRSQALIHLRKEYCDPGRCMDCRFGYHLLKRAYREGSDS